MNANPVVILIAGADAGMRHSRDRLRDTAGRAFLRRSVSSQDFYRPLPSPPAVRTGSCVSTL